MVASARKTWDVFISHASEDKDRFVRPLAESLKSLGASVWYDEFTLIPGDSLSRSIDKGLFESSYGLVVISHNFIKKPWPEYELRGLVAREIEEDKVIIPIWLGVTHKEVVSFSPPLADKIAVITESLSAKDVSLQVLRAIRPDIYDSKSRESLRKITNEAAINELQLELERAKEELEETKEILSEYQCPICQSSLANKIHAPADDEEKHWDMRETYECGYQCFGGYVEQLCPSDPEFPSFDDYDLSYYEDTGSQHHKWRCMVVPKTEAAKKFRLYAGSGHTKEEARQDVYNRYSEYSSRKYA